MTVLTTFLEFSLNFLSNNLKKSYKIWYIQAEKRCENLNCQKHSICNLLLIYLSKRQTNVSIIVIYSLYITTIVTTI